MEASFTWTRETLPNGERIFVSREAERSERETAALLEAAWDCKVHSFARLSALDFYIEKDLDIVAMLELKSRSHPSTQYPTVFLALRKWLALMLAGLGAGVSPLFVVRFTDGVRWINAGEVDPRALRLAGHRNPRTRQDVEPLIDVPIADMRPLERTEAIA